IYVFTVTGEDVFGRKILAYNLYIAKHDPRFNKEIDKKTGYRTHSILCMPIVNYDGEVVGVAQIINKVSGDHAFQPQDIEVFKRYLIFCGLGITNAQLFEMSVQEYKRNQLLLNLARGIFKEQSNLEKLVQKIMLESQELLKCERCTVYLCDNSFTLDDDGTSMTNDVRKASCAKEVSFSKVFDLFAKDGGNIHIPSAIELSKSKNAQIARHVVMTGNFLNISDIELDGKFGKGPFVDEDGFVTKSMLCMPIYNTERQIFGVTQLINKKNGAAFIDSDANIMEAFAIFTGLGIHNCQMYETAVKLMAKQKVALEVLSYHASAGVEESERLENAVIPSVGELKLDRFDFNDLVIDDDETLKCVIALFKDTGIINEFKIPYDVICRWTCSVKKNYRPVTYHNWRHAFNVAQSMYTMVFTGGLSPVFSKLDLFCLLVGCLCHDLDHRGTNNAFQVKAASPLAILYSTSVMEHHHFDHCIMILNSEGNNIFGGLSPDVYRQAIKGLEHAILSTDLALYFRKRGEFKEMLSNGPVDFHETPQKDLLIAMMMTACDVAAITKPWEIQQSVAQLVANEFFEQGDIEKKEFGEKPVAMMDREKKEELPKMQVGFIDAICIPVYQMFAELNPKLSPMYDGVVNNRNNWQSLADSIQHERESEAEIKVKNSETSKNTSKAADNSENGSTKRKNPGTEVNQKTPKTSSSNETQMNLKNQGKHDLAKKKKFDHNDSKKGNKKTKICSLQ
ncbi:hypothetical protein ScPMuIL_005984, partial [Solemya velum]